MCITYDQIEQACGVLVRGEFNTFIYCCKVCRIQFASGPLLESHILSEHDDDGVANNNYVGETVTPDSPIEFDPANVKIEPTDSMYLIDEDLHNDINYSAGAAAEALVPKRPRGRPRGSANRKSAAGHFDRSLERGSSSNYDDQRLGNGMMNHGNWRSDDGGNKYGMGGSDINVSSGRYSKWNGHNSNSNNYSHNDSIDDGTSGPTADFDRHRALVQLSQVEVGIKRRGRPLGAKNKKTLARAAFKEFVPKRPKGRPPTKRNSIPSNDNNYGYESISNQSHSQTAQNDFYSVEHHQATQSNFESFNVRIHVPVEVKSEFPVAKRGPGRPRKYPLVKTEHDAPKRPRGRPRGTKNRIKNDYDGEFGEPSQPINANYVEETPTRLRERPLGQWNWVDSDSEDDGYGKSKRYTDHGGSIGANGTWPVVKRGPGRPRGTKNKRTIDGNVMCEVKTEHTLTKRPRGRPKGTKNKKKFIKIRPIKIELDESIPEELIDEPTYQSMDQPINDQLMGEPSGSMNQNIDIFCKPFEIKLEDICNSGQFQHWLNPDP